MRAYNFRSSGHNLTNFYHWMWLIAGVITLSLILQGVPPTKFGRVKNVQNLARFLTTVDFDHKYLRNGSTFRKSEKYFIKVYISSSIGWNKFGELWSTNQPVIGAHVDPPNWTFQEIIFWPLGGAGLSNFYKLYNPLHCVSSWTWGAGRPQVGLCLMMKCIRLTSSTDSTAFTANISS